jgi:hypothetical protein
VPEAGADLVFDTAASSTNDFQDGRVFRSVSIESSGTLIYGSQKPNGDYIPISVSYEFAIASSVTDVNVWTEVNLGNGAALNVGSDSYLSISPT